MGIGIAIFSGLGIPMSAALKMPGLIGVGPAIGAAFGLVIGQAVESKHKKEGKIRPPTESEKKRRKMLIFTAVFVLIIGALIFLYRFLQ